MNLSPFWEMLATIVGLIALVAVVGELVSRKSQTPAVLQSAGSALANNFGVALSPVTGANYTPSLGYPTTSNFGMGFGF